jgi:hypothetical protein
MRFFIKWEAILLKKFSQRKFSLKILDSALTQSKSKQFSVN